MADPLLTTLCTICHVHGPKYVCPACSTATCSLACSQKHKAWANCSGKRDPTAYIPASKLKTPAGIDHDYNFLSAIDRERERNQRELVEDRGLFNESQLRGIDEPKKWRRMWFGEEVRFVSTDRPRGGLRGFGSDGEDGNDDNDDEQHRADAGGTKATALARKVRQRLEHANVEVINMPVGMTRQRDNTTAWNRKAARINWCVEWLVYQEPGSIAPGQAVRIRHKALETTPLYRALGNSLAWYRRGQAKDEHDEDGDEELLSLHARKKRRILIKEVKDSNRRTAMQDPCSETWLATPYPTQNPYTAAWDIDRAASVASWLPDEEIEAKKGHRFYLLKPLTPAGKPKELIPLQSDETLGHALAGRTVLEFPTIYALPPSLPPAEHLPEGFVLGSTERRQRQRKLKPDRKKVAFQDEGSDHPTKRQASGGDNPARFARNQYGRRGGGPRGRGRGRGGRLQQQQVRRERGLEDAEEGEVNSEGDEMMPTAARADTSSSEPDTSSDEESSRAGEVDAMEIDAGSGPAQGIAGMNLGSRLVDYGSESDDGSDGSVDEGVDLTKLNPENPQLVAGAIQEIVSLLT